MTQQPTLRVAINEHGVIGKRVADAIASPDDIVVASIADSRSSKPMPASVLASLISR